MTFEAFEIYSIGDGLFLYRVLTGLAMLHESGKLAGMAAIGMMLGLFVAVLKGLMTSGQSVDFKYPLIAFCLYSLLFGITAPVIIIDKVTAPGQTELRIHEPIQHVPIGAAVAGYLISGIGVEMASSFEDAFSVVGAARVTQGGWGRTLETLTAARDMANVDFTGIKNGIFPEFRESNLNYLSDCTLSGMQLDPSLPERLRNSDDPWAAIEYPSGFITTETKLNASGGVLTGGTGVETLSCSEAYGRLRSAAGSDVINASFGDYMQQRYGGAATDVTEAFAAVGVNSAEVSQNYMAASMQGALMAQAMLKGPQTANQNAATIMIQQASEQRRTQWAAEETLLKRVLQPTIGFFEAMIYAVVPFAVFALGLGPFGMNLTIKYMVLTLWVQLFMPILAVVNLFQLTAIEHYVDVQQGLGNPLGSIYGSWELQEKALDWLAFGGTIAATVPSLALFLLFGGAVAATAMAGRLQGGDHVDEKLPSPDGIRNGAVLENQTQFTNSLGSGTTMTGAAFSSWNMQQQASQERSVTGQEMRSAQQTFSSTLSNELSRTTGAGQEANTALSREIGNALTQDRNTVVGTVNGRDVTVGDMLSIGTSAEEAARTHLAIGADGKKETQVGSAPANGSMAGATGTGMVPSSASASGVAKKAAKLLGMFSAGAEITEAVKDTSSSKHDTSWSSKMSAEEREALSVGLSQRVALATRSGLSNTSSESVSDATRGVLASQSSDVIARSDAYAESSKLSNTASRSESLTSPQIAERLAQQYPDFDSFYRNHVAPHDEGEFERALGSSELRGIGDPTQRRYAAAWMSIAANGDGAEYSDARHEAFTRVASSILTGRAGSDAGGIVNGAGFTNDAPVHGTTTTAVKSNLVAAPTKGEVASRVESTKASAAPAAAAAELQPLADNPTPGAFRAMSNNGKIEAAVNNEALSDHQESAVAAAGRAMHHAATAPTAQLVRYTARGVAEDVTDMSESVTTMGTDWQLGDFRPGQAGYTPEVAAAGERIAGRVPGDMHPQLTEMLSRAEAERDHGAGPLNYDLFSAEVRAFYEAAPERTQEAIDNVLYNRQTPSDVAHLQGWRP